MAAVSVVCAVGPQAAVAADGTLYGGGRPGVGTTWSWPDQLVALDRPDDGGAATFYMSLISPGCSRVVTYSVDLPVAPDGSFAQSGEYIEEHAGSSQRGTYTVSGRFSGAGSAKGTAKVEFQAADGDRTRSCSTGEVRWRAAAPGEGGVGGRLKGGGMYGGYTEGRSLVADLNLPLVLKVTGNGKYVDRLATRANNFCEDESFGSAASGTYFAAGPRIRRKRFSGIAKFTENRGKNRFHYTLEVSGRFRPAMVTGTWKMTVVIRRKTDGAVVTRCGGEKLRWRAAR